MERRAALIDQLYRVDGKAEIINGELVLMSAAGFRHGRVSMRIVASLLAYENEGRRGHAVPDNVGFIVDLPNRWSFSPDAALALQPVTNDFVQGAPVFAIEVRSADDFGPVAERELAAKRADYFAAGTLVVWDVDPLKDFVVRVYRASDPASPTTYGRGEVAEGEPAVPDWSMAVDEVLRD